ncbi:hypothetical protein A2U01_0058291, partial [Trifolium medium]|nr:hypothetical protein [Trifolium medium]
MVGFVVLVQVVLVGLSVVEVLV